MRDDQTFSVGDDDPESQVREIFETLRQLTPAQRTQRLTELLGENLETAQRIKSLLDAYDGEFLANPTVHRDDPGNATTINRFEQHKPGERIGHYRLLQPLGEGGFGMVFMAEQEFPVHRRVALKIIKLGMDTRQVIARFEAERQALALMDHPNIAKVFDAGATESGRPYFVMELVRGIPITRYCDEHRLTVRERLGLFISVCHAVQHAHQKAIIHRDIKPSNILVELVDGKPLVKVIDFGVAKATAQHLTERTLFTEIGQLIGTPEYMSPEQAEVSSLDIDTRTDVYSLGVVLYELLAGAVPFDPKTLRSAGLGAIQKIIREADPPRPSTRLSNLGESAAEIAQRRQLRLEQLTRQLRGELEWIPLKAIRKERDRRYASPLQLAEDIQNYLDGLPLLAAPESKAYRFRKFARRHRGPLSATMALVVILLLGVITSSMMYLRAERERKEAQRQKEIAQARFEDIRSLANTVLFKVHAKIENLSGATPARALLVQTSLDYLNKLSGEATDEPQLLREIALGYLQVGDVQGNPNNANLGDSNGAIESYGNAMQIAVKLLDLDPASAKAQRLVSLCHFRLGQMFSATGDSKAAGDHFAQSLSINEKLVAANPGDIFTKQDLSYDYDAIGDIRAAKGDTKGALELYRKSLTIGQTLLGADPANEVAHRILPNGHDKIGALLLDSGDPQGALTSFTIALKQRQNFADSDTTNAFARRIVGLSHVNVGDALMSLGSINEALDHFRQAEAIARKLLSDDSTNALAQREMGVACDRIGTALATSGDSKTAMEYFRKALDIHQQLADSDPRNTVLQHCLAIGHGNIAALLADDDSASPGAIEHYDKSLKLYATLAEHEGASLWLQREMASAQIKLGDVHLARGERKEAIDCYREAKGVLQKLGEASSDPADTQKLRALEIKITALSATTQPSAPASH